MNNSFRGSVNQSQATDLVWTNEDSRDKIKWHLVVLPRLHVTHLPENTTCAYSYSFGMWHGYLFYIIHCLLRNNKNGPENSQYSM